MTASEERELTPEEQKKALRQTIQVIVAAVAGVLSFPYFQSFIDTGAEIGWRLPTPLDIVSAVAMVFVAPGLTYLFFERKGSEIGKMKNRWKRILVGYSVGLGGHGILGAIINIVQREAGNVAGMVGG